MDGILLLTASVIFLATLIRSAFGFGEALVAVPLLALLMPVKMAVPLAVLFSITVAAVVVVQDWRQIHLGSAWRLVLPTLFGIPLGLLLLTAVAEPLVKVILAVVIIAFSTYCLASRRPVRDEGRPAGLAVRVRSGVLGGAYGMNGPPLVVYGTLRRWSAGALPGHAARVLPARQPGRPGRLLAAGLWVAGRDPLLPPLSAARPWRRFSWAGRSING